MSRARIEIIRSTGVLLCDKIKSAFLRGDCDHMSVKDLSVFIEKYDNLDLLTSEEAMIELGLSNSKFYKYKKAGIIPDGIKKKDSNKLFYTRDMIDELKYKISSMGKEEVNRLVKLGGINNDN